MKGKLILAIAVSMLVLVSCAFVPGSTSKGSVPWKVTLGTVAKVSRLNSLFGSPPPARQGWLYAEVIIGIENTTDSEQILNPASHLYLLATASMVDSGGYERQAILLYTLLPGWKGIALPPGYRMKYYIGFEMPGNQEPSTMSFVLDGQQYNIDLKKQILT